jgi:hypothetical protein
MENIPFLVARRRNVQRRYGPSWIAALEAGIGLLPGTVQLLGAEDSILRERSRQSLVRQGFISGDVLRVTRCSLSDVISAWDLALSACHRSTVVCDLLHHPDYAFTAPACCLIGELVPLLEFDADTVGVTSDDLRIGFVVDIYSEDGVTLYETDTWGAWR